MGLDPIDPGLRGQATSSSISICEKSRHFGERILAVRNGALLGGTFCSHLTSVALEGCGLDSGANLSG